MSSRQAYAIEVQGTAAGIVVAQPRGFQFFAADSRFHALDGRIFRRVDEAERAARALGVEAAADDRSPGHPRSAQRSAVRTS